MILSLTLNPCIDRAMFVEHLTVHDANRIVRAEVDAGGKGLNLSRVVAELGGRTLASGFLGGVAGAHVEHVLDEQGVVHRFVQIRGETRTNFSVEDGSGPPTSFNDRGPAISEHDLNSLRGLLPELFFAARWLAMCGSLPPGVPATIYAELTAVAREAGLRVLVDADKEPMQRALEAKPDLIKPNAEESSRLVGRDIRTRDDAITAARELLPRVNKDGIVIISLGAEGAALATGSEIITGTAPQVEVHSTIGSGDSMLGGFLWALEEGLSLPEALRWGIACGAATACTDGSEIARLPVVDALFAQVTVS